MNFIERAILYIMRKKEKTFSLLLLIFIVSVFLVSCFGILNASESLARDIRTSLGAAFYIRANTKVATNEDGEMEVLENSISISQSQIDEIMDVGGVKYYNPINYGFAKSDAIQFIPGDKHNEESNMGKLTALRFSALVPDFANELAVLTEGEHITEVDNRKILISEQLANVNHISIGDVITLTHAKLGESDGKYIDEISKKNVFVQVEVSGIYKLNIEDTSIKPTASVAENEIYASLDVLNELHESKKGVYTGEIDFYITDPAKLGDITQEVMNLQSIDWTKHFVRTNDFEYSKIAEQLSSLGDLIEILLIFVSVVSAAVLTLLLTMRMRSRMREAGILLAAGISKSQILAGFLFEVLSVAVFALFLGYIASCGVTKFLGYHLLSELHPHLLNEETLKLGVKGEVQIENYLRTGGIKILLIYLCQLIVIVASTFVSSIMIIRLSPKEILTRNE